MYSFELKLFLISWFISYFEPISQNIDSLYTFNIFDFVVDIISCFKCLTFWLILICTFDFFSACLFSLIAYLYATIIERN